METPKNILRAIAGESMARNKYTYFASKAKKDGFEQIAAIFEETADNEKEHAKRLMKLLHEFRGEEVKSTLEGYDFPTVEDTQNNLLHAASGENFEYTKMYPEFATIAKKEGFDEIARVFVEIGEVEKWHEKRYLQLLKNIEEDRVFEKDQEVLWKCRNCGYVHNGNEAPKICPACAHPVGYYELYSEDY